MKLLKTGLALVCILSLTASCASYHSCPAYAEKPTVEEQQITAKAQPASEVQKPEQRSL